MDRTEFETLARHHLASPEDLDLKIAVDATLAEHPEWTEILSNVGERPTLPTTAKSTSRSRKALGIKIGAVLVIAAIFLKLVQMPSAPLVEDMTQNASAEIATVLTEPLAQLVAQANAQKSATDDVLVRLRSPLIAASAGRVLIEWVGITEDIRCNIVVRSEGHVVWSGGNLRSPALSKELPANGSYEVSLIPIGLNQGESIGTTVSEFVTVARSGDEPITHSLNSIIDAVSAEPKRLGEAIATWWELPNDSRESEIGTRLGLWLGGEAQQPDMVDAATEAAQRWMR